MVFKMRVCPDCGSKVSGRIDKKFCSEQCRNNYNNMLRRKENIELGRINRILLNNRKILMRMHAQGCLQVSAELLLAKGYEADYVTQIHQDNSGTSYRFCYDYGFAECQGSLRIVKGGEWLAARRS